MICCQFFKYNFNPRSRVGNDGSTTVASSVHRYFNPRSRVGNDTATAEHKKRRKSISIHVPAWGTTTWALVKLLSVQNFNPRSRVGNDGEERFIEWDIEISIHVPAWGTTLWVRLYSVSRSNFNPRSRVGNDSKFQQFFTYIFV